MGAKYSDVEIEKWKATAIIVVTFSDIEDFITGIISHYFTEEKKRGLFQKELLGIDSFNRKYELLKKINKKDPMLEEKVVSELKTMYRIRNAIVHKGTSHIDEFLLDLYGKSENYSLEELRKIYLASMEITYKTLENKVNSYRENEKIRQVINDLEYVEVRVRNFKGWFVDIYDLTLHSTNGEEISIDYPNYEFSVENYEDEVEKAVRRYLEKEYSANGDDYEIEVILDWAEPDKY